ncbi:MULTISPECIES: hypothetical protein [unclassified Mesorhizobium]|uniref:hypothetical protein n=1 Tax=unclassified Mesorhizobium TaxID=325217 RepID=UPI000FD82406|nr:MULTISPECIES: hypothetical protein [unclassified Mesorhizobium]TGT65660.1 hypothetical protein EN809_033085 [Mesorhizobium sp. M2E.F.Ca.ET.166.01.1.1]TGV97705.1 hypothetical protein EN797_033095 [Mesorhizobium sp. M2E.F.Ca.ET.154.01.1.1]
MLIDQVSPVRPRRSWTRVDLKGIRLAFATRQCLNMVDLESRRGSKKPSAPRRGRGEIVGIDLGEDFPALNERPPLVSTPVRLNGQVAAHCRQAVVGP